MKKRGRKLLYESWAEDAALSAYGAGFSDAEIEGMLGMHPGAVHYLRRRYHLPLRRAPQRPAGFFSTCPDVIEDHIADAVAQMREDGMFENEIHALLGTTHSWMRKRFDVRFSSLLAERTTPDRGGVYIVAAPEVRRFKIGIAASFKSRMAALKSGSPVALEFIACYASSNPEYLERAALRRAKDVYAHVHGEWFEGAPTKEQCDALAGI